MTLAIFKRCTHMPNTVQFVTGQILVDVTGLYDIAVAQISVDQLVRVVRNIHLFFTQQFPVVAIRGTIEHVKVVGGTHAVSRGTWAIIGHLGGTANSTLASVVDPGTSWLFHLIQGLVNQKYVTSQSRWSGNRLLEEKQHVVILARCIVRQVAIPSQFVLELYD